MKSIKKIKQWLPQKISAEFPEATSAENYNNEFESYKHENMIMCLNDERCDTIRRGVFKDGISRKDNIFLTPHFL